MNLSRHGNTILKSMMIPLIIYLFFPNASALSRTVTVGIYENKPKIFTEETGQPAGIFIDILEAIAKDENWHLKYVPGSWEDCLNRLSKGEIDLMPDVAFTTDRDQVFTFNTEPVLSSWSQVYARKGSKIQSILDLEGKRIAVLKGSIQEISFTQLANGFGLTTIIIPASSYISTMKMVADNEADAAITNNFFGLMNASRFNLENTAVIFNPTALFFATPRNLQSDLLNIIDDHILKMKQDSNSIYYQSMKKWTSEKVHFQIPHWIVSLGLITGAFLLMSLIGSLIMKQQVDARTSELANRNEQMVIIDRTLRNTTSHLNLQFVLEKALNGALNLTDSEGGALFMKDPESGQFFEGASINISGTIIANSAMPAIQILDNAFDHSEPILLWDPMVPTDYITRETECAGGLRYYTAFRMQVRDEVIGILCIYSRIAMKPDETKLNLVRDICAPVALAMENARLYEQVKNHAKKLEQQVSERTKELAAAMIKAQDADRIKSAFLATMSHELRTPLNSIIGFTGIMLQGLAGPLNEEQQKQMSMVQSSSRHLLALINDVLDISKIEAGQLDLSISTFNLRDSIEKMVQLVAPGAEKKGIKLSFEILLENKFVSTDQRRMEQIILNLLNNAIKFTEKGHVNLSCLTENSHFLISISDTGIGIKSENLNNLFQPFHQIDTGLSRKHEGTGLGLSICKKLLELMGGSIRVDSIWGKGSTFTVQIPMETGDIDEKM